MSLMRPYTSLREDMSRIFNEMEQMFSPFMTTSIRSGQQGQTGQLETVWVPPVDVIDQGNEILVKALVPGVNPEDVDIEVENDALVLTGEFAQGKEQQQQGNVYRQEIPWGRVHRRVQLPSSVLSDKANARFENGLLTITLPKSEQSKRHKIQISKR